MSIVKVVRPFKIKEMTPEGMIAGYASVFGVVDSDNEVIDKGAFKRTIGHKKGAVPVLWQHDRTRPCGWGREAAEDEYGLAVKAKLLLGTVDGDLAHEFAKGGIEAGGTVGLSIGFRVPANGSYIEKGVRHFREVELLEYSIVTWAANARATVTDVKRGSLPPGDSMENKDFNSTLAGQQAERDLMEERWSIESALYESMQAVIDDEGMSPDEKKTAATANISQYADAISAWWSRKIDLDSEVAAANDGEKSGRAISAATAKAISAALDHMAEADINSRMSGTARRKARAVLTQLVNEGSYRSDTNKPNPVGGGKSQEEDGLAELLAATSFRFSN